MERKWEARTAGPKKDNLPSDADDKLDRRASHKRRQGSKGNDLNDETKSQPFSYSPNLTCSDQGLSVTNDGNIGKSAGAPPAEERKMQGQRLAL